MGISENGMFGASKGKVGKLVYYKRKGKNIVRTIGRNTKEPSPAQLRSRMELSVASVFSKVVKPFITYGFAQHIVGKDLSQSNVSTGYVMKSALIGEYPDISIDYEKVVLSEGPLLSADQAAVTIVPEGLEFSWYVAEQIPWPDNTDQVMVLAYFPGTEHILYNLFGPERTAGKALLKISEPLLGKYFETYIAFISADRSQVSDSVYTGGFNKPA
ncbi:MAG: hypothetical protein EOO88_21425 [Pedobacter sp.]|nr:MAG: hypothetical protein EOO88_21425 [Pedobacter sp.]